MEVRSGKNWSRNGACRWKIGYKDEIDVGDRDVPPVGGNAKTSETGYPCRCLGTGAAVDMADTVDDGDDAGILVMDA